MSEEINNTGAPSSHDYATLLITFTDAQLLDELEKNQWLMGHTQMSPVDYKARYFACQSAIYTRLQTIYQKNA